MSNQDNEVEDGDSSSCTSLDDVFTLYCADCFDHDDLRQQSFLEYLVD